jgi:hypothetical protein
MLLAAGGGIVPQAYDNDDLRATAKAGETERGGIDDPACADREIGGNPSGGRAGAETMLDNPVAITRPGRESTELIIDVTLIRPAGVARP